MKRTAAAVSLLTAAALTCLAGCSGTAAQATHGATASPARQQTPAERLTTLMVTAADLGTGYSVREFDPAKGKRVFARSAQEITGNACTPLAAMTHQLPLGRPQASLSRLVATRKAPGTRIHVTLAGYGKGMAVTAMDTLLADAVQGCSLGFSVKANGTGEQDDPFEPEDTPALGDEALAYRGVVTPEGGTPRPIRTTVVRHGDVIAVCTAVGGARIANPTVLAPVIEAQDAMLRWPSPRAQSWASTTADSPGSRTTPSAPGSSTGSHAASTRAWGTPSGSAAGSEARFTATRTSPRRKAIQRRSSSKASLVSARSGSVRSGCSWRRARSCRYQASTRA